MRMKKRFTALLAVSAFAAFPAAASAGDCKGQQNCSSQRNNASMTVGGGPGSTTVNLGGIAQSNQSQAVKGGNRNRRNRVRQTNNQNAGTILVLGGAGGGIGVPLA